MMNPNLEILDENGHTPLHSAVAHIGEFNSVEIVQNLVLKGANRSVKD